MAIRYKSQRCDSNKRPFSPDGGDGSTGRPEKARRPTRRGSYNAEGGGSSSRSGVVAGGAQRPVEIAVAGTDRLPRWSTPGSPAPREQYVRPSQPRPTPTCADGSRGARTHRVGFSTTLTVLKPGGDVEHISAVKVEDGVIARPGGGKVSRSAGRVALWRQSVDTERRPQGPVVMSCEDNTGGGTGVGTGCRGSGPVLDGREHRGYGRVESSTSIMEGRSLGIDDALGARVQHGQSHTPCYSAAEAALAKTSLNLPPSWSFGSGGRSGTEARPSQQGLGIASSEMAGDFGGGAGTYTDIDHDRECYRDDRLEDGAPVRHQHRPQSSQPQDRQQADRRQRGGHARVRSTSTLASSDPGSSQHAAFGPGLSPVFPGLAEAEAAGAARPGSAAGGGGDCSFEEFLAGVEAAAVVGGEAATGRVARRR